MSEESIGHLQEEARPDRRGKTRQPNPPCPTCGASGDAVQVTVRTGFWVYLRCAACARVWQLEKPSPRGLRRWDR